MSQLEPLDPEEAVEMYLNERRPELAPATLGNQERHLERFVEWCAEDEGIENMNELTGRALHRFRQSRADDGLAQSSLQTQLSTIRQFIRFSESIDGVESGLSEKMLIPPRPGNSRDEKLEYDRASDILAFLERYHYASRDHALFVVLWHCGVRMGAAQSLDIMDFDRDEQSLHFVHRPESGTTLKNGLDSERYLIFLEPCQPYLAGGPGLLRGASHLRCE